MSWKGQLLCISFVLNLLCAFVHTSIDETQQQRMPLEEKVQHLQDSLLKKPIMSLKKDTWKTYVMQAPRNYSMIVMFTVLSPRMNCPICKPAYEEFLILANSYRYAHLHTKGVYFAMVDYEEAPEIFQQLNLNTAPAIYHFPSKGTRRKQDVMDFQRMGIDADAMAKFVAERTGISIRVLRPPSYAAPVVVLLLIMLVLGLLYMRRNNLEFLWNRSFWGIVCLCIVFAFMSGQMWNHIRGPPFLLSHPQTRQITFIHGSTQFQLISETYIVLAMYACVTAGFIILNDAATNKVEFGKRRLMACVGLGFVVIFFSLLLSIFRSKYQGYPYHFLFS